MAPITFSCGIALASDVALAESLFRQGKQAMEAGDYERACSMLQESNEQDPASGTLLALGRCLEKSGKIAQAWAIYNTAAALARHEHQRDREARAQALSSDIESRLPRIRIVLSQSTRDLAGLKVERNGVELPVAVWNNPAPVDPGPQVLIVSAPGRRTWQQAFEISAEASEYVVPVPDLEAMEETPSNSPAEYSQAAEAAKAAPQSNSDRTRTSAEPTRASAQRAQVLPALFWTLVGAGVSATASGSYFAIRAQTLDSQSKRFCNGNSCNVSGLELRDRASSAAEAATFFFIAGAGLLVTAGVTRFATRNTVPAPTISFAPIFEHGPGAALVLTGRL